MLFWMVAMFVTVSDTVEKFAVPPLSEPPVRLVTPLTVSVYAVLFGSAAEVLMIAVWPFSCIVTELMVSDGLKL